MSNELALREDVAELERLPKEQAEVAVTSILKQAHDWLARAVEFTTPAQDVADFKAYISTVTEAAKQQRLSKEIVTDSTEMLRRSERALGLAIREGQERGEIASRNDNSRTSKRDGQDISFKASPSDFESKSVLSKKGGLGIYDMTDDVTDDEFNEALTVSREQGNVSRANVVRNIKKKKEGEEMPVKEKPKRPRTSGVNKKDVDTLRNVTIGLNGYVSALDVIAEYDLDNSVTAEEASTLHADLSRSIKALNNIARILKIRKDA